MDADVSKRKTLRHEFLQKWNRRYPSFSGNRAGVIKKEGHQLLLLQGGEIQGQWNHGEGRRLTFSHQEEQVFNPWDVLVSGDWVEVFDDFHGSDQSTDCLQLLSPNLNGLRPHRETNSAMKHWMDFLHRLRCFFQEEGFQELQTPTLVPCPGTEPFLLSFETQLKRGSQCRRMYLPTSPELHLKKALSLGWGPLFEIRPCFRNDEHSPQHQPEFYMLEWYRPFAKMDHLIKDLRAILVHFNPTLADFKWERKTIRGVFKEFLDFDLTPQSTFEDIQGLAQKLGINSAVAEDFDDLFFLIYVEKIEPRLKEYEFLILEDYPPSQAALARLTPEGWGDRFEFYVRGMEIANAFNELNDPVIQRERAQQDLEKKKQHGWPPIELDEDFFQHLEGGMPPSCGIALGVERLFMALYSFNHIKEFKLFSYE